MALAAALSAVLPAAAQAAETVVTLGFDDGLTSQYAHRDILDEHGVKASYFVNSGKVGQPNRITWSEIGELAAEGHEIGGHTVDHLQLPSLDQAGQTHQICDDKATLEAHGFTIRNLAYPFGLWNATTKLVAAGCGYQTARTTGGTDWPGGPVFAETFPPLNAYTLRAIMPRLDTDFATWQDIVQKARDSGGGWVDIVLHDLCVPGPDCDAADEFAVSTEMLDDVLDWLGTLPDVKIRTTAHAMDVGLDGVAPEVELTTPADGATIATVPLSLAADASDAVGVARVDFLVDGDVVGSDDAAPYSVEWDASGLASDATIEAEAFDEAGHATVSDAHVVHPDVTAPDVELTAPQDGEAVTGTVVLRAEASDDLAVERVEFSVDGVVVGSDDAAPYGVDWDSSPAGDAATITAEAF
ncbi:MAG: Ig-like domain-containing protein, partial [Conexibacter sp.]